MVEPAVFVSEWRIVTALMSNGQSELLVIAVRTSLFLVRV